MKPQILKKANFRVLLPYIKERVKKRMNGCITWTAGMNGYGYGRFSAGSKFFLAHRVVYFSANPDADQSLCVLHHCDNRACVNVRHLYLGTQADNNRDMQERRNPLTKENLKRMSIAAKKRWADGIYTSTTWRRANAARRKTWQRKKSLQTNIHA